MQFIIQQRGAIKAKLTHFTRFVADMMRDIHNIDVDVQEQDYLQLELRSTKAEKLIDEFNDIQIQLETIVEEEDLQHQYDERDAFTTDYYREMVFFWKNVNKIWHQLILMIQEKILLMFSKLDFLQ